MSHRQADRNPDNKVKVAVVFTALAPKLIDGKNYMYFKAGSGNTIYNSTLY